MKQADLRTARRLNRMGAQDAKDELIRMSRDRMISRRRTMAVLARANNARKISGYDPIDRAGILSAILRPRRGRSIAPGASRSAVARIIAGMACLLIAFGSIGCAVMNTGPLMIAKSIEATGATMTTLVGKFDPKNMTARAGMKVNNPEFVMETVVAPAAFYIKSTLRLIGAEAGAEVSAAGVGRSLDPEVVAIFERRASEPGDLDKLLKFVGDMAALQSKATANGKASIDPKK